MLYNIFVLILDLYYLNHVQTYHFYHEGPPLNMSNLMGISGVYENIQMKLYKFTWIATNLQK